MATPHYRLHSGRNRRWRIGPAETPEHHVPEPAHPAPHAAHVLQPPLVVQSDDDRPIPRVVVLADDIDNSVVEYLAHHLALLNAISHEPIIVKIHCHGGDLHASWALYDLLVTNPSPIVTMGYGYIGSGATIAFLGGDIRMLGGNAMFFIHDIQYDIHGSHTKIQELAKQAVGLQGRILRLYMSESGQNKTKVLGWMKQETEMTALQAIRRGFADRIITPRRVEVEIRSTLRKRPRAKR